ncbi:MAG: hypothetical protein ACRD5M_14355 [Candidatus Acidiferrales bacterium]
MTKYRIFGVLAAAAAALASSTTPARAQGPVATAAATAVAQPIIEKAISTVSAKPKPEGEWLKAEVIHADANSILVREQANGMMIHAFTYAPPLKEKMSTIADKGGYQYGDKVKIRVKQGETQALEIKGKPSKPL